MSAQRPARIKGFADILSPESAVFTLLETAARSVFARYGFQELRTPLLEYTELFARAIGDETDVVQKEMYSFTDSKGRSCSLRPEATAGVMRAYIDAGLNARESVSRLFTLGPMFRHERPQLGRMRQFHQINCECLGSSEPLTDAEMILMLLDFLCEIGLNGLALKLNSLGCAECRPRYRAALTDFLSGLKQGALCPDCARRAATNPLRILDCKVDTCRELTEGAPKFTNYQCSACAEHFDMTLRYLEAAGTVFELDSRLVRGLDYYCRTTFEVVSGDIGAQSAVAGGGRYDGLVKSLGGPDVPGVGFACGMERLALLMAAPQTEPPVFFIAVADNSALEQGFLLARRLRHAGCRGIVASGGMKGLLRQADKSGARYCLILGQDEAALNAVSLKNMDTGQQSLVPQVDVLSILLQQGFL
ncbi:MAG: histidine--tRNA ligase [Desulfovibrio sp.]|jgi:histidyl-tRNA synthetase|nr:histidine--tRNA ligase [Desulfovibrio sp.]